MIQAKHCSICKKVLNIGNESMLCNYHMRKKHTIFNSMERLVLKKIKTGEMFILQ